jgi:biotin synthase
LQSLAQANSIFAGDRLLRTPNAGDDSDAALFAKLGLKPLEAEVPMRALAG